MQDAILITGASTGLGLETAVYLAQRGFCVYATMRDLDNRAALDDAAAKQGVNLNVLKLDISNQGDIESAVAKVVEESGSIYGLVNNAGIGLRGYFEDLSDAEIRELFEVNVFGTMAVTRAVLPFMRQAKRGRIIIISSVGGRIASLAVSAYCATKFAQEGFGEALAQEVVPFGIYVSLVEPAIIKTERWSTNRAVAQGALKPTSPYSGWFRVSERLADRLVDTSPTKAMDVAKCVYTILTSSRPRLRYGVGSRARLVTSLRRYVPEALFERLYFGEAVRRVTKPRG